MLENQDVRQAVLASEPTVLAAALAHLTGDFSWVAGNAFDSLRRWRTGDEPLLDQSGERYVDRAVEAVQQIVADGAKEPAVRDRDSLLKIAQLAIDPRIDRQFLGKLIHHLEPEADRIRIPPTAVASRSLKVTIVGAGMSGLGLAFALADAGIDFEILEAESELGGVWNDNVYPDCGVDTQAFQYAFDGAPNLDWTRFDVKRDEILAYIQSAAEKHGVVERIQFGAKVINAEFVGDTQSWRLSVLREGHESVLDTDVVVLAVGSLNRPKIPAIPGLESFAGEAFHTARWRTDVPLEGKRVALVGNGSSGVQVARSIADVASSLVHFQRSPHWIRPRRPNEIGDIDHGKRWILGNLPNYLSWYRFFLDWDSGDRDHHRMVMESVNGQLRPSENNEALRQQLADYIRTQLGGQSDLIAKVTPDFPPYAKRLVVDNGWYETLTRPHVELVTEEITAVDETGIIAGGHHHDVDVIVFATGFHGTRYFWPLEVTDEAGKAFDERFGADDDLRSYLGVAMAGYPNLFSLQGPNSSIGHGGGATFMSECQGRFILNALKYLIEEGGRSVAIKPEKVDEYNELIDSRLAQMVWTYPGQRNRFHNTRGRVVTNHPFTLVEFFERTRSAKRDDFVIA